MNADTVISVEGVTKAFPLRQPGGVTLKSWALGLLRPRRGGPDLFRALDDVRFEVRRGETLGIIGANGAGKSTLLSLVAGTMRPTAGQVQARGRISSLLELGAGFHPELTGRENVFLYGAIMGLSRQQIRQRFDAIVAFAGLESFIDQPVKHYSSGMYVRLGFAVAVEVDPDVLLIDEVLAVGDADFQRKCLAKMEAFRQAGKTLLIISHDLPTIQAVSHRILHLDHGKVFGLGDPESVVKEYQSLTRERGARGMRREWGTGDARIESATLLDENGQPRSLFAWGRPLRVAVAYRAARRIPDPVFGFAIRDDQGRLIYGSNTQIERYAIPAIEGDGSLRLEIERLTMAGGNYLLSLSIHSADHRTNFHRLDNFLPFRVEAPTSFEGCHMPCRWSRDA
jgi:ABC-type polysaccharide/polyol phosphate transport system ATPase subunit